MRFLDFVIGFVVSGLIYLFYLDFTEWTPERERNEIIRIKQCETPELVTQVEGVKLYRINPKCEGRFVYFSRSGVSTTERTCRPAGKMISCNESEVHTPNK